MKFFKAFLNRIKNPSLLQGIVALVLGSIFIAVALVLSFKGVADIGAYIFYGLSALSLAYIIYILIYGVPKVKARTIEVAERYEFTDNLVKNYGFRTFVLACLSFTGNILFVIYNAAIAVYYTSVWYGMLTAYYVALSCIRGGLIFGRKMRLRLTEQDERTGRKKAVKSYLHCGICLILMSSLIVGGIVMLMNTSSQPQRSVHLIYVIALYTFVRVGFAIYNLVKASRYSDPITKALRNVGVSDALVSLLALQTGLLDAFGNGADAGAFNMGTGVAVCFFIIAVGVTMVIKGALWMKAIKEENSDGTGY